MSDQHEPDQRTPEPPRDVGPNRPAAADQTPVGDSVADERSTESLTAAPRLPDDGGETVRLRPVTAVPGPAGESGAPPTPDASDGPAPGDAPDESPPGAWDEPPNDARDQPRPEAGDVPPTGARHEPPTGPRDEPPPGPRDEPVSAGAVEPAAEPGPSAPGEVGVSAPETGDPDAGSADPMGASDGGAPQSGGEGEGVPDDGVDREKSAPRRSLSSAGTLIWVLLALFGFTLVVQLRSNNADEGLATARQEDLVRILSDLEARDQRLQAEITALEQSQRQLTSGVQGRQAAVAEAQRRANELGLLAGTLPGRGPGLRLTIDPKGQVKASAILNAVQELRGAGGEVMEIAGAGGTAVRIVASTYFVDAGGGGIVVDDTRLDGPYTLWVIGVPQTMQTALQIPGGVVASVSSAGGSVTMEARSLVEVTAVRKPTGLQYARPVS
jgi:uncharacterized protein YlxW (UPF0749 family)